MKLKLYSVHFFSSKWVMFIFRNHRLIYTLMKNILADSSVGGVLLPTLLFNRHIGNHLQVVD